MNCDQIQCKKCNCRFVFRLSKPVLPRTYPSAKETETRILVAACPECPHVYDYSDQTPQIVHSPWGESGNQVKSPLLFFVSLECETEVCEARLQVLAPRKAGTTEHDIQAEVPTWTLHDLICSNGHPILHPRANLDKLP